MRHEYKSALRDAILGLVDEKRMLGFKYESEEKCLRGIDRQATSMGLASPEITREFAEEYTRLHPNETQSSANTRCSVIRVLARYMVRKGMEAYVLPPLPAGRYRRTFAPYVFTDSEIRRLLEAADKYAVIVR